MKWTRWVAVLAGVMIPFSASAKRDLFEDALRLRAQLYQRIEACGYQRVDAHNPWLPRPQVPAHEAFVNSAGQVVAYTYRSSGYAQRFEITALNGQTLAWITVEGDDVLAVSLPLGGKQAQMSSYFTPAGQGFLFYCRSTPVNEPMFWACVEQRFIQPAASVFCD